jgi:hypothetical protein
MDAEIAYRVRYNLLLALLLSVPVTILVDLNKTRQIFDCHHHDLPTHTEKNLKPLLSSLNQAIVHKLIELVEDDIMNRLGDS